MFCVERCASFGNRTNETGIFTWRDGVIALLLKCDGVIALLLKCVRVTSTFMEFLRPEESDFLCVFRLYFVFTLQVDFVQTVVWLCSECRLIVFAL